MDVFYILKIRFLIKIKIEHTYTRKRLYVFLNMFMYFLLNISETHAVDCDSLILIINYFKSFNKERTFLEIIKLVKTCEYIKLFVQALHLSDKMLFKR